MERHGFDAVRGEVEAFVDQGGRYLRAQRRFVAGEVVGMGVGNESTGFRIPWVQPQVELRQMQAALETNFNQSRGG